MDGKPDRHSTMMVRSFFSYGGFRFFAMVGMLPVAFRGRVASPALITCRPYASRAGDSR